MTAEQRPSAEDTIAELRALADALLERVEPWLRVGAEPGSGAAPGGCGWCPLCALAAALRGERPELARRLAEQGAGWVILARTLLDTHDQTCTADKDEPVPSPVAPVITRIPVRNNGCRK